jgi:hypothetical protein
MSSKALSSITTPLSSSLTSSNEKNGQKNKSFPSTVDANHITSTNEASMRPSSSTHTSSSIHTSSSSHTSSSDTSLLASPLPTGLHLVSTYDPLANKHDNTKDTSNVNDNIPNNNTPNANNNIPNTNNKDTSQPSQDGMEVWATLGGLGGVIQASLSAYEGYSHLHKDDKAR